tara:strand:- start:527 stop:745 length:219 start_codon:yes stop_codon:yes gene_type:complete
MEKEEKQEIVEQLLEVLSEVNEPFITEKELSEKIGVTKVSLYNWRTKGKIPFYRLGKQLIRYKLSEVMKRIN